MHVETPAAPEPLVLDALPCDAPPADVPVSGDDRSVLGLAELLLKAPSQLDAATRDPGRQAELIPRLLSLALAGLSLFAVVLVMLLLAAPGEAAPAVLGEEWTGRPAPALALGLAYPLGLVAAAGICLPTFYFFGLLAGVRVSVLQVTAQVLEGEAATAVLLLGLVPVYLAVTLGMLVFHADPLALSAALDLGLALPFLAGLWGVRTIYRGFLGLADTLPPERRCRRTCFLRRLTAAWAAVYTVVTPVMIWSLYHNLAASLG